MRISMPLTSLLAAATVTGGLLLAGPAPAMAASTVEVTTAAQLRTALGNARPGDTIHLADGTYKGNFHAVSPATASARITLTGSAKAALTASGGYGLHLNGASY